MSLYLCELYLNLLNNYLDTSLFMSIKSLNYYLVILVLYTYANYTSNYCVSLLILLC